MASRWAAVAAETDPLRRARQLQRSWERLLADGALAPELPPEATAGLRPTIVESWRRSLATGLDPTDSLAPIEADESEVLDRWFEHPLGSLPHVLMEQLRKVAEESRGLVVVTDASGLVLHRVGDEWLKERAAEMNLVEGAGYSEAADGTNGIGTALAADHAFQVFAFEHFNERHHEWVCSGAPVRDPMSGQTVGLIDLSSLWKVAHPRSLELVTDAARTIERCLADARRDRDARLRRRYGGLVTRSTDLLLDRDGYLLDGAEPAHARPLEVPDGGGEVVLRDGSVAVAEPLGHGEAYLLRRPAARGAKPAPPEVLERAEKHVRELATEQAALRRVATLVARESSPDRLFAVVAEQVARVFGVPLVRLVRYEPDGSVVVGGFSEDDDEPFPIGSRWPLESPGVTATVRRTGRPARLEDYGHVTGEIATAVRGAGLRSAVASPIVVAERLWGAMVVLSPRHEPLPEDTEARLTDFAELVATAIANAESRVAMGRLAEEQAALRRVATLVARGAGPERVFQAVAAEVGVLFGSQQGAIVRFEDDGTVTVLGATAGPHQPGQRVEVDPGFVVHAVRATSRSARFDTDDPWGAEMPSLVRSAGIRSAVASPIVVQDELWGAVTAASFDGPLAPGAERRLTDFTELVGTAVANTETREEVTTLADEQAALRRVATLVARGAPPMELFAAVAEEVGRLHSVDHAYVTRFDPEETMTVMARWTETSEALPVELPRRFAAGPMSAAVREAGGAVRLTLSDELEPGVRTSVAAPITVEGNLWGCISAASTNPERPPAPGTETRLANFSELVATAIANSEAREAVQRLAEEQAALRRVATLVAREAPQAEVFGAIAEEIAGLLGIAEIRMVRYDGDHAVVVAAWGQAAEIFPVGAAVPLEDDSAASRVFRTRRPVRIDDYATVGGPVADTARPTGVGSVAAAPIRVGRRLWGAMTAGTIEDEPLPPDTESRLAQFTELMATAIANAEAHAEVERLAEDQAALRRVATLVAEAAPPAEIFSAVSDEVAALFHTQLVVVGKFDGDPAELVVAGVGGGTDEPLLGTRWALDDALTSTAVFRTGLPARLDPRRTAADADVAAIVERLRPGATVAVPIKVEGRLWGAMIVSTHHAELPLDTEERLQRFTDLIATALANAEARAEVERLAEEQAALRRVAVLVAQQPSPGEVFTAVTQAVGLLLDADLAVLHVFPGDGTATTIASWSGDGPTLQIGSRFPLAGDNLAARIFETRAPARMHSYDEAWEREATELARSLRVRSAVGAPILVEGKLWGALMAATRRVEPWAENAETRIAAFTELAATAIANAESREARAVLTEEQAALRRVATLVAQGAPPQGLIEAVAEEIGHLLPVGSATMGRFEPDGSVTTVASWSTTEAAFPTGRRWPTEGTNVAWLVFQTGEAARLDDFSAATDPIGVAAREAGIESAVGCPVVVKGRLWGVVTATSSEGPMPPGTEARLASFTELVATAIANAESSAELAASRRRIVAASDDARRRIERDLHDGTQQRLVSLALAARAAEADVAPQERELRAKLSRIATGLGEAVEDLQELSRGIHPAILSDAGLAAALETLALRSAIPVQLELATTGRFPEPIEIAAYFVASEALANAAKHARASRIDVQLAQDVHRLLLSIRDDGVGGVDPSRGTGLVGLTDRVEALGGTIKVDSTTANGTRISVTLPIAPAPDQAIENLLALPHELGSPTNPT